MLSRRNSIFPRMMLVVLLLVRLLHTATSFIVAPPSLSVGRYAHAIGKKQSRVAVAAKKNKNRSSSKAKGFGKIEQVEAPALETTAQAPVAQQQKQQAGNESSSSAGSAFLQSIENGSTSKPKVATATVTTTAAVEAKATAVEVDNDGTSPEERAAKILREKYGMKTLAEQQLSAKQLERRRDEQKKWAELKKKAETDNFDIMDALPAPLLVFIDRFLKGGLAICSVLFILGGLGITLEAWSKTSGNPLPENVDAFVVNIIEPNFTPGLLVLLAFSVSLGIFAALQLGSQGATYRED